MAMIIGITAFGVILVLCLAVFFANGARTRKSKLPSEAHPVAQGATTKPRDRVAGIN